MRKLTTTLIAVWVALTSPACFAWGEDGHRIIATLAQAQLSPAARQAVDRLLASEPGATLASISTWADEHRTPTTAPWHYVNFPRTSCSYEPGRDCPDGKCIVAAIDRQVETLQGSADDEKKLLALKYLVHLVGDVHQPLHAGYQDDRGGNTYQLQAFMRGSNLHAFWDTGLLKSLEQDNDSIARALLIKPVPPQPAQFSAVTAAEESCKIVGTPGFYPPRLVTPEYVQRYTPQMLFQLALAGHRLSQVLNAIFR